MFGPLDHHNRGIGHINAHFDNCGGHQYPRLPALKTLHGGVFVLRRHLPVDQPHLILAQHSAQPLKAILGRGEIQNLALLDQRTHPIGLAALTDRTAKMINHFVGPLG